MARATEFTAVPGWGGVLMGVTAIVTSVVAGARGSHVAVGAVWIADAVVACAIAMTAIVLKARRSGAPLVGREPGAALRAGVRAADGGRGSR